MFYCHTVSLRVGVGHWKKTLYAKSEFSIPTLDANVSY